MANVQNPNRAVSIWQFAPSVGSNVGYPTSWVDLTNNTNGTMVQAWSTKQGKQRELGLAEAGTASVVCRDVGENLNPLNTTSPWNSGGNSLKVYRPIRHCEMPSPWTGNLINSTNDTWLRVRGVASPLSYSDSASFEGGTVGGWTNNGTTTTVASTAVRAHDGTKSMLVTWPTQTGGGVGGAAATFLAGVPLRAGYVYTASVWVWITSGPAVVLRCNGQTATSTSTTGAWQRVVLTFTAADGNNDIYIYASGNTTSGQNINVDSVQLEYAGSASTFGTSGPTVSPVFTGFIERYPHTWQFAGFEGWCQLECVDALGMMPRVDLLSALEMEITVDTPNYWWGFDDGGLAGTVFNQKGITKDPAIRNWGGASAASASALEISTRLGPGPDAPGVLFLQPTWSTGGPPTQPDLGSCFFNSWVGSQVGGTAAGFSFEIWFVCSASTAWNSRIITFIGALSNPDRDEYEFDINSTGHLTMKYFNGAGTVLESVASSGTYNDSIWHHLAFTTSSVAGTITSQVWVDAVSVGTASRAAATVPVRNNIVIGTGQGPSASYALIPSAAGYNPFLGYVSNLAIYQGVKLPSASITRHYQVGAQVGGYTTEKTGARLARILAYAGWVGLGNNIDTTAGVSVGPARGFGGGTASDALKVTTDTDQGLLYASASGLLSYLPQSTIAASSSTLTFGENTAGGEIPYREGAAAELEPSQVFNQITVNPFSLDSPDINLVSVTATDATSVFDYGARPLSLDIIPVSGASGLTQIQNMAAFILLQKKNPRSMVTNVVVVVGANPSLWAQMLAISLGQCVTWKRRPPNGTINTVVGYIQNVAWSETPTEGATVAFDIEPVQL